MRGDDLIACYAVPRAAWANADPIEAMLLKRRVLRGLLNVAAQLAQERGRKPSGFVGKPQVIPAEEEPNVPVEGNRADWVIVRQRFATETVDSNGQRGD
ncbi:MAG TPA: hypothetical protein VJ398_06725 [Acidimicrobiia bacterium]|nr:hypothetical protein [Acidimicrobiia bacterium]